MTVIRDNDRSRRLQVTTPADYAGNPVVTVDELKAWLQGYDPADTSEDAVMQRIITSTTIWVENYINQCLVQKGLTLTLDWFPGWGPRNELASRDVNPSPSLDNSIMLDCTPVQAVDSIKYYQQGDATANTVDDTTYRLDSSGSPNWTARVTPTTQDNAWPFIQDARQTAAVEVEYTAGYADASAEVPENIKMAILRISAGMYSNRGDCTCTTESCAIECGAKQLLGQEVVIYI